MASPRDGPIQTQTQTQPLTPPADPPNTQTQASTSLSTAQPITTTAANNTALPSHPPTSHSDSGTSKRPRDARLIHLILASLGVSAYQERVPLQLLDFAYRYTSSVLSDAAHIQAEGYDTSAGEANAAGGGGKGRWRIGGGGGSTAAGAGGGGGGGTGSGGSGEKEEVSLASLRMAIGSRMQYQYQGSLPKEFLIGLAKERNRVGLGVGRELSNVQDPTTMTGQMIGGVKLPLEKYCLTGVGWGLPGEWDSEEGEEIPRGQDGFGGDGTVENGEDGTGMGMGDEDEDAEATMEDIFGDGRGEDEDMQDG